jgi:hypothetical protein
MPSQRTSSLTTGIGAALSAVASALESLPAPGMIIGGIAVILHGIPRLTRDVDATVDGRTIDLDALANHFRTHGIVPRIADALEFAKSSQVLLLRHEGTGVDVDLSLARLPFEIEAIAARERVVRGRLNAAIARPEDLIVYKAIAWRPQDQQDIERLLTLHAKRIDLVRVRRIVAELAEALDEPHRVKELDALIHSVVGPASA